MSAGSHDFLCEQGATFNPVLTWKDGAGVAVNLSGFSARMEVRSSVSAADAIIRLDTTNGRISLGGSAGTVSLLISAADSAALSAGAFVYDLELVSGAGVVTRLLQGRFVVSPEVTR